MRHRVATKDPTELGRICRKTLPGLRAIAPCQNGYKYAYCLPSARASRREQVLIKPRPAPRYHEGSETICRPVLGAIQETGLILDLKKAMETPVNRILRFGSSVQALRVLPWRQTLPNGILTLGLEADGRNFRH